MFQSKYFFNLLIAIPLLFYGSCHANSNTNDNINLNLNLNANSANSLEKKSGFRVTGDCDVVFDEQTNHIKLASNLIVGPESRSRCIIRVESPDPQKRLRLVPIALKGKVNKAPATLAISSILIGEDNLSSFSESYTKPTSFSLADKIPITGYTSSGKNIFGINLTISTREGSLEITELEFAIK